MKPSGRPTVGRGLVVLLVCMTLWAVPVSAEAQGETAIELRMERPWFGPDAPLAMEVDVHNPSDEPLTDLRISTALYERVRSRSALRIAFDGGLPSTPLEAFTSRLPDIPPGATRTLRISEDTDTLGAFPDAPDGVYPVSVGVRSSTGPALAEAVTAVAFLSSRPPRPLGLLPVVMVAPDPILDPGGDLLPGSPERLETLTASLESLRDVEVPFGLTVSPVFLGEAAQLPEENASAPLRALAERADVLLAPNTWTRLTDLQDGPEVALAEGRRLLEEGLGTETTALVHPPDLVLDDEALEGLADAGRAALVDGTVLGDTQVTPARPVRAAGTILIPTDAPLAEALAAADGSLDTGRAVADTAMLYFEQPGLRRTVAVAVEPGPAGLGFLDALGRAPWIRIVESAEATTLDAPEAAPDLPAVPSPPEAYTRAVASAEDALGRFEGYTLPDNPIAARLRAALGSAGSTALWDEDWNGGRRYAGRILDVLRAEEGLLEIARTAVTFTSSRGEVPVTVINNADYPVSVRIELSSPKVRFPEGESATIEGLRPPGETVTFNAVTESSGTFPLTVTLTSPDTETTLAHREVIVRSTAVNTVALVLTSAAALFLIAWYGRRFLLRRRSGNPHPRGSSSRD